ncbi:hypothetical protein BPNPMPFG_005632 [Mesorhizobium sp. AR07]|uniref:hypothetical protein n=1 Tax=Mesorhizobium sp. AR07 TaxID=2865838 RepID=UPI002160A532|nr:hypothetical protein [Mesorhizobium sp. AR07]UVK43792.1 hypothetical protein BPNPMPFG_005632 [Mesorhizobium sp. AR07]
MRLQFAPMFSIAAVTAILALAPSAATAATKTAKECNAEYAANKPAIQSSGEKKADFIAACRAGTEVIPGGVAPATTAAPTKKTAPAPTTSAAGAGNVKTAKACDAEYAANKDAIKGSGETKKDFVAACRAGTEVIPGVQSTTTTPTPSKPAPATTTAPVTTTTRPKNSPAPSGTAIPTGANQFATEGQAKARCPAGIVVWVNLKSKIFHFAGSRNYGNTKKGAYICESDATASGFRAAENEKQPQ